MPFSALCPTPPKDAAFHVVFHDNSGGLLAGPSDGQTVAVVKIAPDDAKAVGEGLQRRCNGRKARLGRRRLAEHPEWEFKTPPDLYGGGPNETRRIHVKEGVGLWQVVAR